MEERKATIKDQLDIIEDAVKNAMSQAAEISGLRNWFIRRHFVDLKPGEWPNPEMINEDVFLSSKEAFGGMIDPDDTEYFESFWYIECDTEKGVFNLEQLVYESKPL